MKVLVTGATGLLGRAVVQRLKEDGHEVVGVGLSRSNAEITKLDLTDEEALKRFLDLTQPAAIIHTAAERRPDVVENSPEACRMLNVEVPRYLAEWCRDIKETSPLLINISTDYVFDGVSPPFRVDDTPNPLNAYGMSKWQGELAVQQNGKQGRVSSLRVPVLYGRTETNAESAVNVLLDALISGPGSKTKKMDANAVRYPTSVSDVAKALSLLCSKYAAASAGEEGIPPLLHFSAMEAMTKYDMCLVMARSLRAAGEEAETDHLEPEYEVDPSAATTRPRHCKLDLGVIKGLGVDVTCVSFEAWWREYLQEYAKHARARREEEAAKAAIEAEEARRQEEEKRRAEEEEERLEKARQQEEEERRERERIQAEKERHQEEEERKARELEEQEKEEQEERNKQMRGVKREEQGEEVAKQENGAGERQRSDEAAPAKQEEDEREAKGNEPPEKLPEDQEVHEDHSRQSSGESATPQGPRRRSSLTEPTSPNPSFSSLRARPTPPATSGRSSPSPSVMSGNAVTIPSSMTQGVDESGEHFAASASTSLTETPAGEGADRQVDPLIPSEEAKAASATPGIDRKGEEKAGFFPAALASTSGASSLGIDFAAANARDKRVSASSGDADSDGYGQPSPRDAPASASSAAFTAGYGEVQFGLKDADAEASEVVNETSAGQNEEGIKKPEAKAATFQIRVGDPQKIGDPMTAHIVYTVRIKTDSPAFKASQFSVLRRYSDFRWLHAALVHNNPGIFIPPVPEKVKLGRFAPDLVEARRHGLETCINKIANNVRLQGDEDLKLFLESAQFQADVKVRDQIKGPVPTPEQKTYFGWSTSLTGNSYKYHETDEWFEEQRVYLDHLEQHLKNLVRIIANLSQQRKDMAAAISDFSHAIMMLSGSSLSRSLSTCFAGLGEVQRRTFELADIQADADVREFASVIYEYERMVGSARKAFSTRIDAWQAWQKYEDESKKIKAKHEKLKRETQGNHRVHDGRLAGMLEEVVAVDTKCLNQKREFDLIGLRCKDEMNRFEWDRIKAFEEACEVWLQGMIERNEELMAEWEQYAALLERQTGEKVPVE